MTEEKKDVSINETNKDIEVNKNVATLSYVGILCLVPLLMKRKSKFAQFHAKQGLVLFIIEVLGSVVFWIPFVGWLLALSVLVVAILGILKTLNGEWWKIPYIYELSKKFNL